MKNKEAIKMLKLIMEKKKPKKPYWDNENGIYETEHCPICHRRLMRSDDHCRCGQAIDWSDVD